MLRVICVERISASQGINYVRNGHALAITARLVYAIDAVAQDLKGHRALAIMLQQWRQAHRLKLKLQCQRARYLYPHQDMASFGRADLTDQSSAR